MKNIVKALGFESLKEFHRMTANVELKSDQQSKAFEDWKENDGSKEGLLKLINDGHKKSPAVETDRANQNQKI